MSTADITDTMREAVAAVEEHGSYRAAARALGRDEANVRRACRRAATRGLVPSNPHLAGIVPHGHAVGKNTIQMNEDGTIARQWPRLSPDFQQIEDWVDGLCERVSGQAKAIKPSRTATQRLLNEYVIGDPHAGMYAWAAETGTDYDVDIFRELHVGAVTRCVEQMGQTEHAVLAILGDLFHADNMKTTERSGNVLDVDGRIDRVMDVVEKALVDCIELAARNCKRLTVIILRGNHDDKASRWMQRILRAYFRKSEHINVVCSPRNRVYHQWERVLLGYHHGDRLDAKALQMSMAQEQAQAWADTLHRYFRCGHIHTSRRYRPMWDRDEAPGVQIEYFPVLAGLEAYGAEAGYSSRRALVGVQHHPEHGEVCRHTITPAMLS